MNVDVAHAFTLAHEIGHAANYPGNSGFDGHSEEFVNLMYKTGGTHIDCDWCEAVAKLAK